MTKNKLIPLLFIIISLIGLFFYFTFGEDRLSRKINSVNEQEEKLIKVVEQIVSSYLKSPATTQFTNVFIVETTENNSVNKKFKTFGDVDSQNSFGALLRDHFNLTLILKGEKIEDINSWTIEQFDFGNENLISNSQIKNPPFKLTQTMINTMLQEEKMLIDIKEMKQLNFLMLNKIPLTKEQKDRVKELAQIKYE